MVEQMRNRWLILSTMIALVAVCTPGLLYSDSPAHGDRKKLPKGCGSCHKGHGQYKTPMLTDRKDVFCFNCHGYSSSRERSRAKGILGRDTKETDLQQEFEKPYRHPIENTGIHNYSEILPETDPSMPRHSECGDCHNHHFVSSENKMAKISGIDRGRGRVREAMSEYEVCFKCHSSSANLPGDQRDKAEEFDISNPSYHPVAAPGKNKDVPSLIYPLSSTSVIKCTDCHNSDDARGPKGPHGSIYRHILARNYSENDGTENAFQYALCYGCHRRNSILGNESFSVHRLHIVSVGASCRTCHNSHGSTQYSHLIDFENMSIRPSRSGRLEFMDLGPKTGQCFLECHGRDHDPETYPTGAASLFEKTKAGDLLRW